MSLKELTLTGERDKVAIAIEFLRTFCPEEGYYLAFSGGKDSVVCMRLLDIAGVKYDAHYNLTTVDPPELVQFIKTFPNVVVDRPKYNDGTPVTMWNLIPRKGIPPTRIARYCCEVLKEHSGEGRRVVTGVRWAESVRRARDRHLVDVSRKVFADDNDEAHRMTEQCVKKDRITFNPIIDWSDADVWDFIRQYNVPYCKLYDEGFKRLGCIGCPMGSSKQKEKEFARYPTYARAYLRTIAKMLELRKTKGKDNTNTAWDTPEGCMKWWVYGSDKPEDEDQLRLEYLEGR